jgi:EmrB/QacA subfamily drug resistance transporter
LALSGNNLSAHELPDQEPHPKTDYSKKWLITAAVAAGTFLGTIDGSIVNIALPTLVRELHSDFSTIQWVVLAYLLTTTTFLLSIGRLADLIGKKSLYLAGFIIFTTMSALCGLATSAPMLIGLRVFQALGAVLMFALGSAIITEAFPANERGFALGFNGLMVSLGSISGPSVGGMILDTLPWRWIFYVNVPVGLVGAFLVYRFVPNHRPGSTEKFDYSGSICIFLGLLGFLVALTFGQSTGFFQPNVIGLMLFSIIFFYIFLRIERKVPYPMINLHLFSNRQFSVSVITGFLSFISSSGNVLLAPFFLQNMLGFSPGRAGLLLITVPVAMGITAPIAGYLSDRLGSRPLTIFGLSFLCLGYLLVSGLDLSTTTINYILRFIPVGIGLGAFQSPNNSAIMGSVPPKHFGIASSLLALTRTTGQTVGISLMGAIWASQVRFSMGAAALPDPTSAQVGLQVIAFQRTILVITGVIFIALCLSIWSYLIKRNESLELA